MVYIDPPFNTGRAQTRRTLRHRRRRRRRPHRLRRAPLRAPSCSPSPPTATRSTTTSASSRRAWSEVAPRCCARTGTLYFHLDYREAHYVQAAARRALRPRVLPQRADLGLRLRRQAAAAAGRRSTTRSSSTSRTPRAYYFDAEAVDREPYMAPGLVTPEKARARQAADRRVVAHDRLPHRAREDRLPDAEARGARAPLRAGLLARPGDLCLDPFAGSGTLGAVAAQARPPLPADRREPGGRARSCASASCLSRSSPAVPAAST